MQVNSDTPEAWMTSGPGAQRRILCENPELMMVEFRFEKIPPIQGNRHAPHMVVVSLVADSAIHRAKEQHPGIHRRREFEPNPGLGIACIANPTGLLKKVVCLEGIPFV